MRTSTLSAVLVAVAQLSSAAETKFANIFANPSRFNHKRVTITGLADVGGDAFWVWRDAKAWRHAEDKGAIFVAYKIPAEATVSPYDYANARFVRVTGTIDTSIHGHLGMDPFSLVLERVEVLPGPRQKEFLPILGYFRNETRYKLHIKITDADGYTVSDIPPGKHSVFAIKKGAVLLTTPSGKLVAQSRLLPSPRFYDVQKKIYYFRISNSGIESVVPQNAKGWTLSYAGDRD
jgi:hypothetical protein